MAGVAGSLRGGVALAEDLISTGQAMEKFRAFADLTQLVAAENARSGGGAA